MTKKNIHILYENPAWLPPLEAGLKAEGLDFVLHDLGLPNLKLTDFPLDGIYLNRISPSSHTRGHTDTIDFTVKLLVWLEENECRVINGSRAFALEISKIKQDEALRKYGIKTPRTVSVSDPASIVNEAKSFSGQFLIKHDCSGKGLGIHLFNSSDELSRYVNSKEFDPGPNGKLILQEYIKPKDSFITRIEIVGGKFLFAMQSSTESGFELCPSDACQIPSTGPDVCPADGGSKFSLSVLTKNDPLVKKYIELCDKEDIDIAGIEFVEDGQGVRYTYDINGTTNYSSSIKNEVGIDGMREIARFVKLL